MDRGWVKLWRRIEDNDFLSRDPTAYYVFVRLLVNASFYKGTWSGSVRGLASHLCINYETCRSVLKRLEQHAIVTQSSTQRRTTITICNWSQYQSTDTQPDTKPSRIRHATDTQTTDGHKEKKNKKKNKTYTGFEYLEPALTEFIQMRKVMKRPITEEGIKRLVNKLEVMYPNDHEMQKASLIRSTDHNWLSVFLVKDDTPVTGRKTDAWL